MPSAKRLMLFAGGLVASVFAVRKFRGGGSSESEAEDETSVADLGEEEPPAVEAEQAAEEEPEEEPKAEA